MIEMTRIDSPAWAPPHARHDVSVEGQAGRRAQELAAPHRAAIFAELERRILEFANDPERCFLAESEGFPLRERLAGSYYIGSETYDDEGLLWIFVRCLERPWHPNQT